MIEIKFHLRDLLNCRGGVTRRWTLWNKSDLWGREKVYNARSIPSAIEQNNNRRRSVTDVHCRSTVTSVRHESRIYKCRKRKNGTMSELRGGVTGRRWKRGNDKCSLFLRRTSLALLYNSSLLISHETVATHECLTWLKEYEELRISGGRAVHDGTLEKKKERRRAKDTARKKDRVPWH